MPQEQVLPRFFLLTLEGFLIWDNWIAWEQEFRCVQHEWDKSQAFLAMKLPLQLIMAKMITDEEQAQYKMWKSHYLNRPMGLEREMFGFGE